MSTTNAARRGAIALLAAAVALPGAAAAQDPDFAPTHWVRVTLESCLILRRGPGTDAGRLDCLARGTELVSMETLEDWMRVRIVNGREGWVSRDFVVDRMPAVSAQGPASDRADAASQARLDSLQSENARLQATVRGGRAELERQRQTELDLRAAVTTDAHELDSQRAKNQALERDLLSARRVVDELRRSSEASTASHESSVVRILEQERELSSARETISQLEGRLVSVARSADGNTRALEAAKSRAGALSSELAEANAEAARLREELVQAPSPQTPLPVAEPAADTSAREGLELLAQWMEREGPSDSAGPAHPPRTVASRVDVQQPLSRRLVRVQEPLAAVVEEALEPASTFVDVVTLARDWAKAWQDQRVDDYLSFYAEDFVPADGSRRSTWERLRRQRVTSPAFIDVTLSEIAAEPLADDRTRVRFTQTYQSDSFGDTVVKVLDWVRREEDWKIVAERQEG